MRAAGLAQVIKSIFTLMAKLLILPVVLAQAGPMINCSLLKRAPKQMSPKKLHFRNGNTLANISAADSQTRLLRAMEVPLGQLSSAPERARLLATDEANSILSAQHTHGFQASQYSPYGHRTGENRGTALGYNGELLEPFDFYLLGHGNRAYSTRLMRFLSPDRTGIFFETNFNCYAYAAGDPINYTDPSGNTPAFIKTMLRWLRTMRPRSNANYAPRQFLNRERHEFKNKEHFINVGIGEIELLTDMVKESTQALSQLVKDGTQHKEIPTQVTTPSTTDNTNETFTDSNTIQKILIMDIEIASTKIRKITLKLTDPKFR